MEQSWVRFLFRRHSSTMISLFSLALTDEHMFYLLFHLMFDFTGKTNLSKITVEKNY